MSMGKWTSILNTKAHSSLPQKLISIVTTSKINKINNWSMVPIIKLTYFLLSLIENYRKIVDSLSMHFWNNL